MEPTCIKLVPLESNSENLEHLEIPLQRLLELCIETNNLVLSCNDNGSSRCQDITARSSNQVCITQLVLSQLDSKDDKTIFMELTQVYMNVTNLRFLYEVVRSSQFGQAVIKQIQNQCDQKGSPNNSNNQDSNGGIPESTTPSGGLLDNLRTVLVNAQKKYFPAIDCDVSEEDLVRSLNIIHNAILHRKLKKKKGIDSMLIYRRINTFYYLS